MYRQINHRFREQKQRQSCAAETHTRSSECAHTAWVQTSRLAWVIMNVECR